MAFTLYSAICALSPTHDQAALQGHGGVRARTPVLSRLLASPSCNSSSRTRCILSPSNTRSRANILEQNSHGKLAFSGRFSNSSTHLLREVAYSQSSKPIRGVTSASLTGPTTVAVAANLFQLATAFVVPFYTVMILAPQWEGTKKMMESELTYFILGVGYIYLLWQSWTPETLGLMFSSKYWLPELSGITRMFSSTITVASAWLHLLAADLFAGRQIFLDGLNHNVETRHSLVLCLMMCPIGIFSHLVTKSIVLFSRRARTEEKLPITNEFPPYTT
ncbi:unnamed protein product [Calypogeia fissa]